MSRRTSLVLQSAVALVIVAAVGWQFAKLLGSPDLQAYPVTVRLEYLVPAGFLYLGCHTLWGSFFYLLLRFEGANVPWLVGVRTYFVSQFGKYLPLKVWVIVMRVEMLNRYGVTRDVAGVTGVYETLVSMGAGAVIGVCLLPWTGFGAELEAAVGPSGWFVFVGVGGFPLLLGVLNKLAARIVRKSRGPDARPLPSPSVRLLALGLLLDSAGWCLLGLSLWCVIQGLTPGDYPLTGETYLQCLSAVALSYVAGFLALVLPGGLGARELLLQLTLARQLAGVAGTAAAPLAAAAALVVRLVWTVFEVGCAGMLWWLARPKAGVPG